MAFFSKNGSGKQADSNRKRRHSLNAWLLYFGIASMGLTGVTFSKYSTTITGTITVQVAQAFTVTFLGYEKDETEKKVLLEGLVYEGQYITEVPEMPDREVVDSLPLLDQFAVFSLEDSTEAVIYYRDFLGWNLDGEPIDDPTKIVVDRNLEFEAVYSYTQEPADEVPVLTAASPSEAENVEAEIVAGGGQAGGGGAGAVLL